MFLSLEKSNFGFKFEFHDSAYKKVEISLNSIVLLDFYKFYYYSQHENVCNRNYSV